MSPLISSEAVSMYYFATPGAVDWSYNTRQSPPAEHLREQLAVPGAEEPNVPTNYFAALYADGFLRELLALPVPWPQVDDDDEALVELVAAGVKPQLPSGETQSDRGLGFVMVHDRQLAAAIGYLTAGDLPRAAILVKQFPVSHPGQSYLLRKPFAMTAVTYIMLSQLFDAGELTREPWYEWIGDLMDEFPWLCDSAIQYGWLKLLGGHRQKARAAFLEAFRRGLPFYSLGVRWLLDGLTILSRGGKSGGSVDTEVVSALKTVRAIALRTDMGQPFTCVRFWGAPQLHFGRSKL